MRSRISYSKEMRDRAERDGKVLASIDFVVGGTRMTYQGPATERESELLQLVALCIIRSHNSGAPLPNESVRSFAARFGGAQ